MAIAADFTVAANGDIRWDSGSNYTVIEFHRFLQDLADDAVASADVLDITDETPSDRSTDNIITLNAPYNIDDTTAEHLYDGSITQDNGDTVYSGLVVVGAVPDDTQLMIVQDNAVLTSYWGAAPSMENADAGANILLRVMIKTRVGGADIDGKRLRIQARELGDTYAEFSLTAGLGNATAAIFTSTDLNNQTAGATIATWDKFTNTEGYQSIDVNGDSAGEPYYALWDIVGGTLPVTPTINDLYEWTKYTQRRGETTIQLHSMDGELFRGITHQVTYTSESGTGFVEDEVLTWGSGSTAGSGALLATDDGDPAGTLWIQLLDGATPTGTITGAGSTATTNVVTSRTVSPSYIGASTGSAIIGAYGIAVNPNDTTASDQFFDLDNTLRVPPNNVIFTVGGLVSGEDRVLVGPDDSGLDTNQLTGATGSNAASDATWVVNESIPSDTPASGTVRVFNGSTFDRVSYDSYTGSTFTLSGTLPNAGASHTIYFDGETGAPWTIGETLTLGGGGTAELLTYESLGSNRGIMVIRMLTGSDPVDDDTIAGGTSSADAVVDTGTGGGSAIVDEGGFISYLDVLATGATEQFTSVYLSPRTLFVRVRDGGTAGDNEGIKTFETTGSLGSAGGSTTAIRTSDV